MSKQCLSVLNDDGVLLCGYYKKLKTMKKKFFVLYNDGPCKVARIEYYDNEKKYKSGFTPKRIIKIKNCFNINRRLYTKHDYVIVLSSKEGGFGIVMDSEDEMNTWLRHLLHLQRSGETCFDFPQFDYVWQVVIQKKGIAEQHNIFGSHHICLTNKSVTFIKIAREKNATEKKVTKVEVLLTTIRRCGDSQCYFYMEIGRQSSLGPGELWMETEDSLTAQNMHKMILSKMVSLNEALMEPMRKRSSSATETTNPHHDRKATQNFDVSNNCLFGAQNCCRDRCDSLPSRNRTSSESSNRIIRITPNTLANRVVNFNVNNASPNACSASEESVSVEDCEEGLGMYLISSRSPEGVIPEEYTADVSQFQNIKEKADTSYVANSFAGAVIKANLPTVKQCSATRASDTNKDICGNIDDQLHSSTPVHSLGNDVTREISGNRVRAFSVGSRIRSTRINSKASPKLFSSDCVDSSTRKSVSVPVLINKHLQSIDQMGDLMEIDFSKSVGKSLNRNLQHNRNECQNTSYILPRNFTFSNSEESVQKSIKKSDNGYLEMKPITLDTNRITSNGNSPIDNTNVHSKNMRSFEKRNHKMDSATPIATTSDIKIIPNQHDTSYLNLNNADLCTTDKDDRLKTTTSTTSFNDSNSSSTCSEKHDSIKLDQLEATALINKDLYYASLDLPKSGNEVNNRYGFQESLSDTSIEEIKNEYAKINFVQADTSRNSTKQKY